jgi:tRNA-Thr(GGU) m(6)t(6)A37 methyltransferase TsaA
MAEEPISYLPIGVIRSDHTVPEETPVQPVYARDCRGRVEVFPPFVAGLADLEGFSHLFLLYHFHRAGPARLRVVPFLQDAERGIFATRAPVRPNAIGISVVALERREDAVLHVTGVDILDGTPLLDIKPYVARFDRITPGRNGWQDEVAEAEARRRGTRRDTRP